MNSLRGEFQVQLTEEVTIDVMLNLHAINLFLEEEGAELKDLTDLLEKKALRTLPKLIWAGARTSCLIKDTTLPMNFEKFAALFGSVAWDDVSNNVLAALQLDQKKS